MKRILIIVLALALLVGGAIALFSGPTPIEEEIRSQFWTLVRLTVDGENLPLPEAPTLGFMEGNRYSGSAAVNSYGVYLDIDRQGKVTFGDEGGGVTEMAGPPHLMALEEAYLVAFFQVETAKVSGLTLILKGKKAELEYRGTPAPARDLSGDPEETVSNTAEDSSSPTTDGEG